MRVQRKFPPHHRCEYGSSLSSFQDLRSGRCVGVVLRLLLLLCLCPYARTQTIIHVPVDQPTIQLGINAASNGDTVLVAPGTYFENVDFKGKAITLVSSGGAAATIIDAGFNGPAVQLGTNFGISPAIPGQPAVLDGFTVQHSKQLSVDVLPLQGAVEIQGNATVQNNTITDNEPVGIFVGAGNVVIQANHVLNSNPQTYLESGDQLIGGVGIQIGAAPKFGGYSIAISSNLIEANPGSAIENYYVFFDSPSSAAPPLVFAITGNILRNNEPQWPRESGSSPLVEPTSSPTT